MLFFSAIKIWLRFLWLTRYNNTYNYLIDNNLVSQNQSGFKRGDSCINQLISIRHDILNSLDEGPEVRG